MDPRYEHPGIAGCFTPDAIITSWMQVEQAVAMHQNDAGLMPDVDMRRILNSPTPTAARVAELERETHHDVEAFVRALIEQSGSQWVHHGMTSSDLVDTANAIRLDVVRKVILAEGAALHKLLIGTINVSGSILRVGRTHGQHAEPTSLGKQLETLTAKVSRAGAVFNEAYLPMKLSGPVGVYTYNPPSVELGVSEMLQLSIDLAANQVVDRSYYAAYAFGLVQLASACEAIAMFIRLGSQAEVDEMSEGFTEGQAGSSSMPHKRNPVRSERICGLARVARGLFLPLLETESALWGERDISNSSVERVALRDLCCLVGWMLHETYEIVQALTIRPELMAHRVQTLGLPTSAAVLFDEVEQGSLRSEAYAAVQSGYRSSGPDGSDQPEWYLRNLPARQGAR